LMARPFQKQRDEFCGDLVIFYQQDPKGGSHPLAKPLS
jgi:hypothetical protein